MNSLKKICQCKELKNKITFQIIFLYTQGKKKKNQKGTAIFLVTPDFLLWFQV